MFLGYEHSGRERGQVVVSGPVCVRGQDVVYLLGETVVADLIYLHNVLFC